MNRKNILVTGGAGQVGLRLCQELLQMEHHVICIDNLCTGSKMQISSLLNHPHFEFIRQDVTERYSIEADVIYHLAYPESIEYRHTHPIEATKTALIGTLNTLEIAKRRKCPFHYPELITIANEELRRHSDLERYYTDLKTMEYMIHYYVEKFGVEAVEIKLSDRQ